MWTVHNTLSYLLTSNYLLIVLGNRSFLSIVDSVITNTLVDETVPEDLNLMYQELHVDAIEGYFILLSQTPHTYGTVLDFRSNDFTRSPFDVST